MKYFILALLSLNLMACADNVSFSTVNALPAQTTYSQGLNCKLYKLPSGLDRTPELEDLTPDASFYYVGEFNQSIGTNYSNSLNVIPLALHSEYLINFALKCSGLIEIEYADKYTFSLSSDDGSELNIDGKIVALNDFNSYETNKSGSIVLGTGLHEFNLIYRQGPANHIALVLKWELVGINSVVPQSVFFTKN